jgi:N-acetyl-alpha-D-muramate 1-phosphate uridylyltransferase
MIDTAMVLAAGFGRRMRPLTDTVPKPLVEVAGKPLIGYAFDRLREAGVTRAVVNGHYLADQIEAWGQAQDSPRAVFSDERDEILETGGGIVRALPLLGNKPFFVMNADCFWIDGEVPALQRLSHMWDAARMDCLLLLCDPARTTGYDGAGDFSISEDGRLTRATHSPLPFAGEVPSAATAERGRQRGPSPVSLRSPTSPASGRGEGLAYIGGYIVHPRFFADAPKGAFSTNVLWDRAISQGRLFGLAHDGWWLHVGTMPAIAEAEARLKEIATHGMPR